jgi:hypothetical protein
VARLIERTLGRAPVRLQKLGGSLPNEVFADMLELPTVFVPHFYAAARSTRRMNMDSARSFAKAWP